MPTDFFVIRLKEFRSSGELLTPELLLKTCKLQIRILQELEHFLTALNAARATPQRDFILPLMQKYLSGETQVLSDGPNKKLYVHDYIQIAVATIPDEPAKSIDKKKAIKQKSIYERKNKR